MTRRRIGAALAVGLIAVGVDLAAGSDPRVAPRAATAGGAPASGTFERYHYSIAARVRPLLVFWIGRSGVGDAIVTRRLSPGEAEYALLIGSDPDRAPRHINRWGYIKEEIRGAEARLVGLMTESDEDSIDQAEANLKAQAHGDHPFKIIRATVHGEQAQSVVTSIGAPRDYNYRQLQTDTSIPALYQPELIAQPQDAVNSAAWFWWTRHIGILARAGQRVSVTRAINGGTNGIDDRIALIKRAIAALGG